MLGVKLLGDPGNDAYVEVAVIYLLHQAVRWTHLGTENSSAVTLCYHCNKSANNDDFLTLLLAGSTDRSKFVEAPEEEASGLHWERQAA